MKRRRGTVASVTLAALLAASACDAADVVGADPTGMPTPTPTASYTRYVLPDSLCEALDLTPITQLYPHEDMADVLRTSTDTDCYTTFDGPVGALSVNVELILADDTTMRHTPRVPRDWYVFQRDHAAGPPTDINGIGSGTFWYGDGTGHQITMETYDGNLNARLWVFAVGGGHTLAQDMPDRVATVAASIFTRLAPN